MQRPKSLFPFLACLAALGACPVAAEDRGVVYAGLSAGDGIGGFAGAVVALPGGRLGKGLAVRGGANAGEYSYVSGGGDVEARYVGAEVALVYQASGDWGWANFGAGPRVTDTRLSPNDPGNRLRGTRLDAAVGTDGAYGDRWRLGWFASFGINNRAYVTQLRLGRRLGTSATRVGIEGGVQGDRSYTRGSAGGFLSAALGKGMEGVISVGLSEQAGRNARPYAGIAVSKVF
jgi:hypothetical protein